MGDRPADPVCQKCHTDAQVAAIAASIKEWGWTSPALVGEDGGLIAGHARVLAARQLGIAEIPVMVAAGWSEMVGEDGGLIAGHARIPPRPWPSTPWPIWASPFSLSPDTPIAHPSAQRACP